MSGSGSSWFEQLEARLEQQLEAFLQATPEQEALLQEQAQPISGKGGIYLDLETPPRRPRARTWLTSLLNTGGIWKGVDAAGGQSYRFPLCP